jgi:hypothetical protein
MSTVFEFARISAPGRVLMFLPMLFFAVSFAQAKDSPVIVAGLLCEYEVAPVGVDVIAPRLSWKLNAGLPDARAARQSTYQILAASSPELLAADTGDVWDSGKVASDDSIHIPFAGKPLASSQRVFWKVRVWDQNRAPSAWSAQSGWTMGILKPDDWGVAKWIGAPDDAPVDINGPKVKYETVLLRREFLVKPGLRRALVNVCGLGQYELTLNGAKAGDDLLAPGWTKYDKTCLYDTRDITPQLRAGKNAVGIELASGMYNVPTTRFRPPGWEPYTFGPLKAIAQIRLEYADGSVETVATDASWRVAPGPITSSSIYSGEDFDARLVQHGQHGWGKINFDDSKWTPAVVVNGPGGELRGLSCAAPPIRFFEIHKPVSSRTLAKGDVIFDLGQNASHVPKISVAGPAGSKVRIIPSELGDGLVSGGSMGEKGHSVIWCDFTKATDGVETWSPKFFYIGCRYLEVKSFPAEGKTELPAVKSIEGVVVHSSAQPVGEFSCSNELFNKTYTLVRWAQRSNMMSILTDCPQREKRGWLEQDHLNGPALRYNFALDALFSKIANDMADSQTDNGMIPTTAPAYSTFGDKNHPSAFGDSPEWGSAFLLVPWQQYEFTGDTALLRSHYDAMKRYVAYLAGRAKDGIVDYGLGDWFDIGPKKPGIAQLTPIALTATAFYFYDTWIVAQTAKLIGNNDDAAHYAEQAETIRAAFNKKFFNADTNQYATGSQCANSIPLVMGIAEPSTRQAVLDNIVKDVKEKGLTAGDVGYRYLLRALADGGRSDVVFEMNNQSDKPGYGMQLAKGATSLTEAWDAARGPSQNHFMLGQINEWFFHDLAGIQSDPSAPGFKKIIIKPAIVGDLTWVKAHYDSIHGRITSEWKRSADRVTLNVVIPANTVATIYIPARDAESVLENGKSMARSSEVRLLRTERGVAVFELVPGSYEFSTVL